MNRSIVLLSCFAGALACAEPITFQKFVRGTVGEDGTVSIAGTHGAIGSAGADLRIDKPAKITLKMRRTGNEEKDGHFGFHLHGGDGLKAHLYTHNGADFIAALHRDKTRLACEGNRGGKELFPADKDAPWIDVELYVQPQLTELHAAGKPQALVNGSLLPITNLSIYGYHNDVEVRDVAWELLPEKDPESTDPNPSFHAMFENTAAAQTAAGELAPTKATGLSWVPGVTGQGIRIATGEEKGKRPELEYDATGVFANYGTVMFWMKSDWDGAFTGKIPIYPMVRGLDAEGKEKMKIFMYYWISFGLGRTGDLKQEQMQRKVRSEWYRGDWNHVAMVWREGGWCKAFFNGLPYEQPFGYTGKILTNLDLKSITRLKVGVDPRVAEAAFDDLRVYKRALSNGEIYDAYRGHMPIDFLVDRTVVDAGKPEEVVVLAAPGGFYMRPMPVERPLTTGTFDVCVKLTNAEGTVVAEKDFPLELNGPVELRMPVENFAEGDYRLTCHVGGLQRSFEITAYQPKAPMPPTEDGIELGNVIFEKDLKDGSILESGGVTPVDSPLGEYLEAGPRKMNRFAFEVPFPESHLDGRPVMLEIEWPDDKPRSMGLYMYPESKKKHHRDRLGGGIQSGVEYPLTGKMQRTRYLFHPGVKSYLFEARTMVMKYPAAIAGFRVYEIKNDRLPKLAINYPDGVPSRRFGYWDEDETFDQNLGWDYGEKDSQVMTERLLDYLDYTGQNFWQYPFMRYNGYNFSMRGTLHSLYPYRADAYRYMVDAMSRRGKRTIAEINLFTLPELYLMPYDLEDCIAKGWTLTKYDAPPPRPGGRPLANHANPDIRKMIVSHVKETARRFAGAPDFDGINFNTHKMGIYPSLEYGYDDYTVNLFVRETGVAVTATKASERYEFLTQEPQREAWLKWRDGHTLSLFRQMRAELDSVDPALKLYLSIPMIAGFAGHEAGSSWTENTALLNELRGIKGVYLVPVRYCTQHRHRQHWGKASNGCNDVLFDPEKAAQFVVDGKPSFVNSYPAYFESFNGSLKNDVYASYFQNADVKPFGRYFLKELAFAVSAMDAQRVLIGAQPLGTWGRDVQAREFAKAYCALPALPFTSAPGAQDPVAVRFLNTDKGTYLYAVSMLWSDCETVLTLSADARLEDLSTGEVITDGRVKLRPYELRSLRCDAPALQVTGVQTSVPQNALDYYRQRLERMQSATAKLRAAKIECGDADAVLPEVVKLMEKHQFAELHRLLFSLPMTEMMDKADNFSDHAEQARMIASGRYAVNCGSTFFYRSKGGTLFFPDQQFAKGNYGYVGSYLNVTRDVVGIQSEDPDLFASESYMIDTYKFKVPAGKYTVRMYLKAGYKKGFKPDVFVFSVDIQGKRKLNAFDVVAAGDCDFTKPIVKEFPAVEVKEGTLDIDFSIDEKYHPSCKFVNAIEVIPET